MPYTPTEWVDEVPTGTVKYEIVDDVNGVIAESATIQIVTPVTAGTPINATNLNKLEAAMESAVAQVDETNALVVLAETAATSAQTAAENAELAALDAAAQLKYHVFEAQIVPDFLGVTTLNGIYNFYIPSFMNGMNLTRAIAMVETPGTTNPTTIQVRNLTKYPSNDALSTAISIASGASKATVGTVNTLYDDVSTDDKIKIYVTGVSTTNPKGLTVILEFRKP